MLAREDSSASASAMHPVQKSSVSGMFAGKSAKYVLCRTWSPTISRTVSSVRAPILTTAASSSPDRRSGNSADT